MADPPESAFGLLADGTRLEILEAIARDQADEPTGGPRRALSFSEIYERVDVENTSRFSYHLGELVGTFLRKDDRGYTFTHAGERIVRMVLAGNVERTPDVEPIETDGRCPYCEGTRLEARLEDQVFIFRCLSCDRPLLGYSVTPAQVRSAAPDGLLESVSTRQASEYRQVRDGFCPVCGGGLSTRVIDGEDLSLPPGAGVLVRDECPHCLREYNAPLPYWAAYHPASIAFHWDHGTDVTALGMWELHEHLASGRWHAERATGGDATYRVTLGLASERLVMTLTEDLSLVRTERVRTGSPE